METPMSRIIPLAALALALGIPTAHAGSLFGSKKSSTPPKIAAKINHTVPQALLKDLAKASQSGLSLSPPPGMQVYMKAINGPRVAKGNKVGILYVGADFCPYCAGQRWALVMTLLRFGHFKGVEYMASSPTDVYSNTPTFSFLHSTYTSKYVKFEAVETADRMGHKLESMDKAQNAIFSKFDAPPYSPGYGSIPFVYVDGQYLVTRPMVSPNDLSGMDWEQIVASLNNPQSNLFQSVMPQINALTAAVCSLDGGDPDDVCSASGVMAANTILYRMAQQGQGSQQGK